jgi:hypothetical protein
MFKRIGLLVILFLHGLLGELSPCLSLLSHAEMAEWLVDYRVCVSRYLMPPLTSCGSTAELDRPHSCACNIAILCIDEPFSTNRTWWIGKEKLLFFLLTAFLQSCGF